MSIQRLLLMMAAVAIGSFLSIMLLTRGGMI